MEQHKVTHDDFDGFTVNVFLDEDRDYLAHFVEMPNVSAFGQTPVEAIAELKQAWELMKECYAEDSEEIPVSPHRKQYSGQFNVRVDKRLHRALAVEAAQAGISLNALIAQKLAKTTETDSHIAN